MVQPTVIHVLYGLFLFTDGRDSHLTDIETSSERLRDLPKVTQPARDRAETLSTCFYCNLCALQLPGLQAFLWVWLGAGTREAWAWIELGFRYCSLRGLGAQSEDQTDSP